MNCPGCNQPISEGEPTWPIDVNGETVDNGCQDCWDAECNKSWWEMASWWDQVTSTEEPKEKEQADG